MGNITTADYLMMLARLQKPDAPKTFSGHAESRERVLHEKIMEFCKQKRWLVIHSRMDMPCTVAKGVPDFILLADQGRVLLVECKTKTGKLSPEQMGFSMMAEQLGHKVHLVRSMTEFLQIAHTP